MEKNNYFNMLLNLYEAVSAEDAQHQQQHIADTGSDVEDANVDPNAANGQQAAADMNGQQQPQQVQGAEEQNSDGQAGEDPEGLQDAAYLTSTSNNVASIAQSDNSKKLAKLFDLMQNLSLYADSFKDTLDSVELGLLDDSILDEVQKYRDALDELTTKIHDYLIDVFSTDTYEKALYAYVIFRTELLVATKQLRDLLKLNEVDGEEKN